MSHSRVFWSWETVVPLLSLFPFDFREAIIGQASHRRSLG
jgi:hypothetical protein